MYQPRYFFDKTKIECQSIDYYEERNQLHLSFKVNEIFVKGFCNNNPRCQKMDDNKKFDLFFTLETIGNAKGYLQRRVVNTNQISAVISEAKIFSFKSRIYCFQRDATRPGKMVMIFYSNRSWVLV